MTLSLSLSHFLSFFYILCDLHKFTSSSLLLSICKKFHLQQHHKININTSLLSFQSFKNKAVKTKKRECANCRQLLLSSTPSLSERHEMMPVLLGSDQSRATTEVKLDWHITLPSSLLLSSLYLTILPYPIPF